MKTKISKRSIIVSLALLTGIVLVAFGNERIKSRNAKNLSEHGVKVKPMDGFPASAHSQVTLMNAFEPPYNKWTFRNAGIFPSLMVPRGGAVVNFPRNINPDIMTDEFPGGNGQTVLQALKADYTDGIIVIKDGVVRYEQYFGDFKENNLHIWASSTKSLVGMLTGILADKGILDLNEKVENYLPELEGSAFDGLSLQQLLNMVSAIDYSEDYVNLEPGSIHFEYFRRIGFVPAFDLMALDPSSSDIPRGNLGLLPQFQRNKDLTPGEVYEYHSPNVDVIGLIISRVTNQSLEEALSEHIWQKLGVEHDGQISTDAAFNPIATGGMQSSLRDFARFGYAILNDGKFNGQQVFPKWFIDETFNLNAGEYMAGQRSIYRNNPEAASYDKHFTGYKNFWWVHDPDKQVMTARGVYGQGLYIDKTNNVIVAHFGSAQSASNAVRSTNKAKMDALKFIAENIE